MKVFNTYFENKNELESFLIKNDIVKEEKILIQVFTGICDVEYITKLIHDLKSLLPSVKIIGSTTDGEILDSEISSNKTVLSISIFKDTDILTYSTNMKKNSYDTAQAIIKKLEKNNHLKLLITFSDGINTNGQEYVKAFEQYDPSLVIAGGLAADNAKFSNTYVFNEDGLIKSGAVAAAFYNENLIVNSNFNFNWESIGKTLTITNSTGNIIHTIDDIPAAQIYKKYLGKDVHAALPATGVEFPLLINKNGMSISRTVLSKYADGSLMFSGSINKGEKVHFGFGNIQAITNNRLKIAKEISQKPCEAIFIYSCMARKNILKDSTSIELSPLSQITTTSGFFTYGEIFHNSKTKTNELLNQTLTTISISESNKVNENINIYETLEHSDTQTIKALTHLASVASKELYDLNTNLENIIDSKTYELRVKNKELLQRHYYDELTSLGNRNLLIKDISSSPEQYALVSIDINSFKNINDLYGMNSGDEILKQFAKLLIKIKKFNHCRVFRVSGNEFAILNKKPKNNNYEPLVEYLNKEISQHKFFMDFEGEKIFIDINITIGITYKTKNLIEKAHIALNQAKNEHKSYKLYESDLKLEKDIVKNIEYTKIIKDAIKNDKVIVYFQAIYNNEKICKYETLMRIEHNNKILSPCTFLNIAKKNGDYLDLTKIIIQKSFEIFKNRDEKFSINLSFEDIADEKIVKYLKEKIEYYNVSNKLIIEILEDESIKNYDLVKNFIDDVKKLGVKIAIDDFGSGYSNFSRILELNIDYIKIDGSIISTIDTNKNSYIVAQTITEFANKLSIKTIAEYIHSEDVYKKAKELGIDEFQGFLLAEPQPLT